MQLIDLHCDTIYELKRRDDGSSLAKNSLSIDLDGMQKFSGLLTGWIGKSRKIKTRSGSCTMEVKLKRTENAERYQQWHPWKRAVFWMGSRNV